MVHLLGNKRSSPGRDIIHQINAVRLQDIQNMLLYLCIPVADVIHQGFYLFRFLVQSAQSVFKSHKGHKILEITGMHVIGKGRILPVVAHFVQTVHAVFYDLFPINPFQRRSLNHIVPFFNVVQNKVPRFRENSLSGRIRPDIIDSPHIFSPAFHTEFPDKRRGENCAGTGSCISRHRPERINRNPFGFFSVQHHKIIFTLC